MVGANEANRTLIGKALNRAIDYGDYVLLGVGTKRDGLNACIRRSVVAAPSPDEVTEEQRFWFDLVEGAYRVGFEKYCEVARDGLPAKLQEQALVDYFAAHSKEMAITPVKPMGVCHKQGRSQRQRTTGHHCHRNL